MPSENHNALRKDLAKGLVLIHILTFTVAHVQLSLISLYLLTCMSAL